jgi:hypothetical protein
MARRHGFGIQDGALIEQAVQGQTPLSHLLAPYNDNAWQRAVSDLTYAGALQ